MSDPIVLNKVKFVQIAVTMLPNGSGLVAVGADGNVYEFVPRALAWRKMPDTIISMPFASGEAVESEVVNG